MDLVRRRLLIDDDRCLLLRTLSAIFHPFPEDLDLGDKIYKPVFGPDTPRIVEGKNGDDVRVFCAQKLNLDDIVLKSRDERLLRRDVLEDLDSSFAVMYHVEDEEKEEIRWRRFDLRDFDEKARIPLCLIGRELQRGLLGSRSVRSEVDLVGPRPQKVCLTVSSEGKCEKFLYKSGDDHFFFFSCDNNDDCDPPDPEVCRQLCKCLKSSGCEESEEDEEKVVEETKEPEVKEEEEESQIVDGNEEVEKDEIVETKEPEVKEKEEEEVVEEEEEESQFVEVEEEETVETIVVPECHVLLIDVKMMKKKQKLMKKKKQKEKSVKSGITGRLRSIGKKEKKTKEEKEKKLHECLSCDYRSTSPQHVKNHVRSVHLREKSFQCSLCDYRCADFSNMTKHVRVKHPEVRKSFRFKCRKCGFKASKESHLRLHLNRVHGGGGGEGKEKKTKRRKGLG